MLKKLSISFMLALLLFYIPFSPVSAKDKYLDECLEEDADCIENEPAPQENQSETIGEVADSESLAFSVVKMFFALLLVLVLIYILLKLMNRRNKMFQQVKMLENLGGISVGQNKSIQLVRIGSRLYIIGVGDNVEMLQEITDEAVIQEMMEQEKDEATSHSLLKPFLSFPSPKKDDHSKEGKQDFTALFSRELNKLKQNRKQLEQKKQETDRYE